MTAWDEVMQTGKLGQSGAAMLYKMVRAVALSRNMPPPEGHTTWSDAAVQETAHDFIAGAGGMQRFTSIALRSTDDDSFRRQLQAAVLNHLRGIGRRSDLGKLIRRLIEILEGETSFLTTPRGDVTLWRVDGKSDRGNTVDALTLSRSISQIPVTRPRWDSETRDAPLADKDSYVRLLHTVLTVADGAMAVPDIAEVIGSRVNHRRTPFAVELDTKDDRDPAGADSVSSDPGVLSLDHLHAHDLFAGLSDRERIALAFRDEGVRELGRRLALGHSQAAAVRQRLAERLRADFADDDDSTGTLTILCELCEQWVDRRTQNGGGTS